MPFFFILGTVYRSYKKNKCKTGIRNDKAVEIDIICDMFKYFINFVE